MIKLIEKNGFVLIRHGSNHDVYYREGVIETIPRHKEVNELLAKSIIKRNNLGDQL